VKPQQSRTIRTIRPYRLRFATGSRSGVRTRRPDCSRGLAERSGEGVPASVEAGVGDCGRGHLPKSPVAVRSYSGLSHAFHLLSGGFRRGRGTEQHVT
jgi:hypothetical protein